MIVGLRPLVEKLNTLHRDLKPDNFLIHFPEEGIETKKISSTEDLITRKAQIVLSDFGVVRLIEEDDKMNETV